MIALDPLRTVELLAVLEEATAPLSHDVRNRLASVRNLAFLVRRKLAGEDHEARDPRIEEFLKRIETEVERTDETINRWAAHIQSVRPPGVAVPVRAVDCARLAIASARLPSAIQIDLSFSTSGESLEVGADPELLALAVRCLIENAGEAVGSGLVRVNVERSGTHCRVTVSDRGPGFDALPNGATQFVSTKEGHLGLGLSMARRIAVRLEGTLVLDRVEIGAEASLLIPLAGEAYPS